MGGLALDPNDPALNQMMADLIRAARDRVTSARATASRTDSGTTLPSFQEAQRREREAEGLLRRGDRAAGMRALWSAAALYSDVRPVAPDTTLPRAATPQPQPAVEETARPSSPTAEVPIPPPSVPDPIRVPPASPEKAPPSPPTRAETPPSPEPPADTAAADRAAIRDTLRRYVQAYEALDSAAVGRVVPSLTPDQLRSLGRDFSGYRSYTVVIKEESIATDGASARVAGQVVRSFETKTGVSGSNTVRTIFHLRRSDTGWTIERLEAR
jgi:hypothetical protein